MGSPYFDGYISLHYSEGVVKIQIYDNGNGYVSVYINNDHADDVTSQAYLSDEYGNRFYNSLEDYKIDDWHSINEVWPEGGKVA